MRCRPYYREATDLHKHAKLCTVTHSQKNSLSHKTLYTKHTKGHSAVIEMLLQCVRGIGSL